MISVYVCDDEQKMLSDISAAVKNLLPECEVTGFLSGTALCEKLSDAPCGILLLDIDMPDINGLEIAQRLSYAAVRPLMVFVTSHDELVYDSLKFHPFGFVRKSHINSELPKMLSDCVYELNIREKRFAFHTAAGDISLFLSGIYCFEASGNYLKVIAADREYRFRETLSAVEKSLSDSGFVRIHKGFLVNQAAVKIITSDEAVLINGVRLPIGRNYSENARKILMRYIMK